MSFARETPSQVHERVFGFRDPAYCEYMDMRGRDMRPDTLIDCATRMQIYNHPIVRYAAGCALTEAALWSPRAAEEPPAISLVQRHELIGMAAKMWENAPAEFEEAYAREPDPLNVAELWGLGFKSRQALAVIPTFGVIANWRGGDLGTATASFQLSCSRASLVRLARWICQDETVSPDINRSYVPGFGAELLCNTLLQDGLMPDAAVVPSPLRIGHHVLTTQRSDLLVHFAAHQGRVRIVLGSQRFNGLPSPLYINYAELDSRKDYRSVQDALQAMIRCYRNGGQPGSTTRLAGLQRELLHLFTNYVAAQQEVG